MERSGRWIFTRERLADTPSRRGGMEADKEARYRRQAVSFIRHVGQKLALPQLWINTASILMHRFFMYQSFTRFDRNVLSLAVLFCVAKSFKEEDGRIYPGPFLKTAHWCLYRDAPPLDSRSPQYEKQLEDLLFYEYVLLATLGFDFDIDHAHTHILMNSHLVTATTALTKVAHDIASRSLEFTTMCLQYKPTAVACFCLQLACQWANWELPPPKGDKFWFHQVDETLTQDLLNYLIAKFRHNVGDYYPHLQEKIMSYFYKESPSHSPWSDPPKADGPLEPPSTEAGPSGLPPRRKSPESKLPLPRPHPDLLRRPPELPQPAPAPQKAPETLQSNHQSPSGPSKRIHPLRNHQKLQFSSKTSPAPPGHAHPLQESSDPSKPLPNPQKAHQNPQNSSKNPLRPHHLHHQRHQHLGNHQKTADVNYLSSSRSTVTNQDVKIFSSTTPEVPVNQPDLEVPEDLLEMAPPDNFDFEHTFMNIVESLASITKSDPSRSSKSDPGDADIVQELSSMASAVESLDSGVFSQSLSQPLSQGHAHQELQSQLTREFIDISGKTKSFSSIFDPPDDEDEGCLRGLDANDNDLSRSGRRKRKGERAVSPIRLKIPRERLENLEMILMEGRWRGSDEEEVSGRLRRENTTDVGDGYLVP